MPAAERPLDVEFIGGHGCLNFTNSLSGRLHEEPVDHLRDYGDLIEWSRMAGILSATASLRLVGEWKTHPHVASAILERAVHLREELYRILSAVARGDSPPLGALTTLNAELVQANSHFHLAYEAGAFRWVPDDSASLGVPLWAIVRSAAELLGSESLSRVYECDAEKCSWLFLDGTRNRSRRWCDTKACGNRARVRRHYWRKRRNEVRAGSGNAHDPRGS